MSAIIAFRGIRLRSFDFYTSHHYHHYTPYAYHRHLIA